MKEKARILIVDDAKALAENLGDTLTMEGYSVSIFNDALSAIYYLEKETPNIIITDLIMPHMTGFEFIQQVRKKSWLSETKVIAVSADLDDERINEGKAAGADLFFSKPFDEDALLKTLDKLSNR